MAESSHKGCVWFNRVDPMVGKRLDNVVTKSDGAHERAKDTRVRERARARLCVYVE